MNHRTTARFRHMLLFAIPALGCANLASAAAPDVTFTPTSLSFKYQIGSALPVAQTLQIKSTGANLSFTLSISGPLPFSAQWLSVSQNSGTTPGTPKVYVNPTGLPAGIYTGTITVLAPAALTPSQTVTVTLDVGDAPATLSTSTPTLTFNWTSGTALPSTKPLTVLSSGAALSATITVSGGTWLKAAPTGSVTVVGLPTIVSVAADPTGLVPGIYTGQIKFTSSTAVNKSVTVTVTLNVSAGVPTITGVWPAGQLVGSPDTTVTLTGINYFSTSVASIGATALTTTYISPTTLLAKIPAAQLATAATLSLVITTPTAASPSGGANFVVYPPGPQVLGVTNSASYTSTTVSPGGIITIYGLGLGPTNLAIFPGTDPIATSLPSTGAATSVTIDGNAAPILYTSGTQVSCIVPYAVAAKVGTQVNLAVTYNSLTSTTFKVNVVADDPGIFTLDSSGTGQGAILNYSSATGDYTVNGTTNAAPKGSTVVIYATGFGQTSPAGNEIHLIGGTVTPTAVVTLTIDGQPATVQGAQAPIGSVPGVLQINATVPAGAKTGNDAVVLTVGTAQSQPGVTLAVK